MRITHFLSLIIAFTISFSGWSQARIVFQNDPFIVLNDQAYLVIDNTNANAITNPAQGNIVSEDEFNYVKWNISFASGVYNMPLTTANDFKVPVSVNITSPGFGGNDHFLFSSYGGLGVGPWLGSTNLPTPVLHFVDVATGAIENSPYVIDRFWMIDCMGYGSRPSATLSIGYADEEHDVAAGNTITESLLGAQRYNSDTDVWGDYGPAGTVNTTTNIVSGIPAPDADFFRVWTLSSSDSPLPVELLSFDARCTDGVMTLKWATASETNNDRFLLERSPDGQNWETLDEVFGAGNSTTQINYELKDVAPFNGTTYYRLTQIDFNGDYTIFEPKAGTCSDFDLDIVNVSNNFNSSQFDVLVSSSVNENFELYVLDLSGKILIGQQSVPLRTGMNTVQIDKNKLSMGVYIIQLVNDNHLLTRKVALN